MLPLVRQLALAALIFIACQKPSPPPPAPTPQPPTASAPASAPVPASGSPLSLTPAPPLATLRRIAKATRPVLLLSPPSDPRRFVVEQTGLVRILRPDDTFDPTPFLDLTSVVTPGIAEASEQGLLGLAFHPDFAKNGRLFVNYTDHEGDTVIAEYPSKRTLAKIGQPYSNHNGGNIVFGPDGKLWVGMGDGGSRNDPQNRGQNPREPLGKMIRLDVDAAKPTPEVVILGVRNPWRFTFDPATRDLWIADVGQVSYEEIDYLPYATIQPGTTNLGWRVREGLHCFQADTCATEGLIDPVAEYDHKTGCSVTGGFVYRGAAIPALAGHYFYADFCTAIVRSLEAEGGRITTHYEWRPVLDPDSKLANVSSFGQDAAGELYVLSLDGPIYKLVAR